MVETLKHRGVGMYVPSKEVRDRVQKEIAMAKISKKPTVFHVFENWDDDGSVGHTYTVFSTRDAARQYLQALIEKDHQEGITRDMSEDDPDDWIVSQTEDSYSADNGNEGKWITIKVEELTLHDKYLYTG